MDRTVEVLERSRMLIANGHWMRYTYSNWSNSTFCAIGALAHIESILGLEEKESDRSFDLLHTTSRALYGRGPAYVNDNIGREAVLKVYDEAIERAKARVVA